MHGVSIKPMIAGKTRNFCFVILSLVFFALIFYINLNTSGPRLSAPSFLQSNGYFTTASSELTLEFPEVLIASVTETTNSSSLIEKVDSETALATNECGEKLAEDGALLRDLYEPGHEIPNSKLCPDQGAALQFIVLITSASHHITARMGIRDTWGRYAKQHNITISFVLGRPKTTDFATIKLESDIFGDIIVSRSIDSYNNLTLKVMSMLEWIDTYCSDVKYILKTDDDVFINMPRLISFVQARDEFTRTLFGRLAKGWTPDRNQHSRYCIPVREWGPPVFPNFMTGPAYLFTQDIVHDIYVTALNETFMRFEDVFFTGVVAKAIQVNQIHDSGFHSGIIQPSCNVTEYISIHGIKPSEQNILWKTLFGCSKNK